MLAGLEICFSQTNVTFVVIHMVKNVSIMWEPWVWSLDREDPLEKEMATHSSILTWRIPRTEKSGGLQSMESKRVRNDWANNTTTTKEMWQKGLACLFQASVHVLAFSFRNLDTAWERAWEWAQDSLLRMWDDAEPSWICPDASILVCSALASVQADGWHMTNLGGISFSSVQFSHSVVSDSLRHHESQHSKPPCPSPGTCCCCCC